LRCIQKYKAKDKILIAGVMRESAKITIAFIKKIADKGVDFATILSPHYFVKFMTDEALIKYYTKIADESPIPIMMYNAPKFAAGLTFSTNLVATLAQHPIYCRYERYVLKSVFLTGGGANEALKQYKEQTVFSGYTFILRKECSLVGAAKLATRHIG
jgi:hypothetical protein